MVTFTVTPHGFIGRVQRNNDETYRAICNVRKNEETQLWTCEFMGRNNLGISDFLWDAEKREIIGLLDALNRTKTPDNKMKERWERIIGLIK